MLKERFYCIRMIKRYNSIGDLQEVWSKVVGKTSVEIIKKLAVLLHIDYRVKPMKYIKIEMYKKDLHSPLL